MKNSVIALIICGLVAFAGKAFADTDYRCLSDCTSKSRDSNTTTAVCYKKCSYNPKDLEKNSRLKKKSSKNRYNEFSDQYVNRSVAGRTITAPEPPQKNYQCITSCVKQGMQYKFCEIQCAK